MKKLFLIFLCVGLLFSVSTVFAEQKLMVNEKGEIRLIEDERLATEAEMRAYRHPGTEVPTNFQIGKPKKVDFFHYVPVREYSEVVIWNGKNFQTIKKTGEEYGEPELALHIIYLLTAIIFITILNILVKARGRSSVSACVLVAFSVASTTLSAVFTIARIPITPLVVFVTLTAVATSGTYYSFHHDDKKKYKIFSAIFYILSFATIIVWLTT